MSEPYVVFADHPGVRPRQQDNPICFANCRAQGRFCGGPCIQRDVSTLRHAVQSGYTKASHEAAYPPVWLELTAHICHHGLVLLELAQDPDAQDPAERTPEQAETKPSSPPKRTRPARRETLDRAKVVEQLTTLRREVESTNLPLEGFSPSFALVLSDVCRAIGLTGQEHDHILGEQAAAYIDNIRKRRWWPSTGNPRQRLGQRLQLKRQATRHT